MKFNLKYKDKLNEWAQKKLGAYLYNEKGWLKMDCPYCGEHKYGINIRLDRTNCFKCGYNPSPLNLIMEIEKVDTFYEVKNILDNLDGISYKYDITKEITNEPKKDLVLPEGYVNIKHGKSTLAKACRRYWKKRGFDIQSLSMAGWGYGTKGKYFGYTIIPYYEENKLIYFTTRLFIGNGPKFNNPSLDDFNIGKNSIIYNKDALYLYDRIFLFESVTNCRTIGDNAIGIGGKVLSSTQFQDIIKSPCKKIIIGLDRDAIQYSIDIAFMLIDYKKVKIMVMPHEKDVNDVGRKKSLLISQRSKYLNYKSLQKFKNQFLDEHKT